MESKQLKNLAIKSVGLMLTVICMSILVTRYNDMTIYANASQQKSLNYKNEYFSVPLGNKINIGKMGNYIGENYIKIAKPNNKYYKVKLEDLYEAHSIKFTINNLPEQYFNENSIQEYNSEQNKKLIMDLNISYVLNEEQTYNAIFNITLDTIYAYTIYENDNYIYINLLKPHDVYDKIIVVDAGHGGDDVGTYSSDMKFYEKDINLNIVLYLKKLLDKENIKVYYTRTTDQKIYLNPRINLANSLNADYFISVHCNSNKDSTPYGTEVLYKNSKKLATICLDSLVNETGSKSLGIIKDENIHIIKKSKVPIALIEVAFMSNKKDLNYLIQDNNQKKIAQGIYNAIMKLYDGEQ